MTTSVKMGGEMRSHLERLQAEIRLKIGTRVTQQEVLVRLVGNAVEPKADLVDSFHEERIPPSASERERFHGGIASSGAITTEGNIDDMLYG